MRASSDPASSPESLRSLPVSVSQEQASTLAPNLQTPARIADSSAWRVQSSWRHPATPPACPNLRAATSSRGNTEPQSSPIPIPSPASSLCRRLFDLPCGKGSSPSPHVRWPDWAQAAKLVRSAAALAPVDYGAPRNLLAALALLPAANCERCTFCLRTAARSCTTPRETLSAANMLE